MKFVAVLFALVALAVAAPQQPGDAYIVKYDNENSGLDGKYTYSYESSDGQTKEEEGHLENVGTDQEAMIVRGSYSFHGPDNELYEVKYFADETGFHPEGAHLPV